MQILRAAECCRQIVSTTFPLYYNPVKQPPKGLPVTGISY